MPTNYQWITAKSNQDTQTEKPLIAFIASSNGFLGEGGQKIIKDRIKLLTTLGFEVKFPVFADSTPQSEIIFGRDDATFNALQNVLIEPNVAGRLETTNLLASGSPAVSPEAGASQIIDCIKNGWNVIPLMGGSSLQDKVPLVREYFENNPHEKNPDVKIFGYSNASWANALMAEGISSYVPTQYTAHFVRRDELRQSDAAPNKDYLEYVSQQADRLESALKGASPEEFARPILYSPRIEEEQESHSSKKRKIFNHDGYVMHYPLNADVTNYMVEDPEKFIFQPKADEKWSFSIEWMMQNGDNPEKFSKTPDNLRIFLEKNKSNLPEFMEVGCLSTRFDGFSGIADLIHDENGQTIIDNRNIDKILLKKGDLGKALNDFLSGYQNLREDAAEELKTKQRHGLLPEFLQEKLNNNKKISAEEIKQETVAQILQWQNETRERIIGEVKNIAEEYQLPLFLNSRFGHVANMNPIQSGPCHFAIQEDGLHLTSGIDRNKTNKHYVEEILSEQIIKPSASTDAIGFSPYKTTEHIKS